MVYETFVNPIRRSPAPFHRTMPGYEATPLRDCPSLARLLGVGQVLVKDEAVRMGLPSFKILGASWATVVAVQQAWTGQLDGPLTLERVAAAIPDRDRRRLVAATDGNHGRGVARMAGLLGLGCSILVPAGTAAARIRAIESEGAEVTVVEGTYDDAIVESAKLADDVSLVISDTSWAGYHDVPAAVIDGYSTMFVEVEDALRSDGWPRPDVVALQAGVGAFAAAGLRHFRGAGRSTPHTLVVEPLGANCLMTSARAGTITEVPGPHTSTMAGLNCGLPSELAWPVIVGSTDVFVAVDDDTTYQAMTALADEGIVAGESGAAGLAGLLALRDGQPPEVRSALDLRPDSCVLVINTEGATDPVNYAAVVGRQPDEVRRSRPTAP